MGFDPTGATLQRARDCWRCEQLEHAVAVAQPAAVQLAKSRRVERLVKAPELLVLERPHAQTWCPATLVEVPLELDEHLGSECGRQVVPSGLLVCGHRGRD